ncbi:MAG: hypothetical protein KC910_19630, partial [Candidatus Eremiobacteraeota bacterium]|nr:hypothetical protein [Candidatus Eremiobacteraeota bacterium]
KAEMEAGSTLEVAKERAAEFFSAGEGSRVYPEDPYHWQYTLEKPYQLYKDELLTDERAPARQLFLQLLRDKKDATSVKHVLPAVPGLDLSQRIDLFGDFQKQKFPTQMFDLVVADMQSGSTLEQARQRTAQFTAAGEQARVYPENRYHWEYTLKPVYGLYTELLEPELEPARQFFLELFASKQSPALVKHVLPEVPGLDLNQRIQVFRELQSGKFAGPMYDLFAADLAQGTTLAVAREHLAQYQQAAEGARVYPEDSYQWRYTLKPSFDLYKDQLLKPDCEAARLYFLELLSQKKDPKAVKVVLNPVANTNLEQRLDLLKELGLFYPAAADLLGDGAKLEQARREVARLKEALEAHPPYQEASYNWEYHQKPALELYHQAGPFGRQVLVVGLQSGQPVDPLRACLKALKKVLNKAETNNLKLDEFQQMLEALDPKDGRPLEKRVEDIIDTMILKKSMEDESEGNLEVKEEEIWVNDIQVARRE